MEALVALGLASNIVQFVDFGFRLFGKVDEIRDRGTTFEINDLDTISKSINAHAKRIRGGLQAHESTCLTELDQSLQNVASLAIDVAGDLEIALSSLRSHPDQSRWKSFLHALKVSWSSDKADQIFQRLLRLRDQLEIQILLKMQNDVEINRLVQSQEFATLNRNIQIIGRSIVNGQKFFVVTLDQQFQRQLNEHKVTRDLAEIQHRETLAAIRDVGRKSDEAEFLKVRSLSPKRLKEVREFKRPHAENLLLENLDFKQKRQREIEVTEAHKKTFQWLFDENTGITSANVKIDDSNELDAQDVTGSSPKSDPQTRQPSFNGFLHWLEHGSGCFWINGKAASGKSTLMKHLHRHPELKPRLGKWAQGNVLHIAAFYFWNSGTSLQKQQEGLLRAILHSVLSQDRRLISTCFAEFVDDALNKIMLEDDNIRMDIFSIEDLRQALTRLINRKDDGLRIFLLVDGVDEYEGDLSEICHLFKKVGQSPTCKVVLSSRPVPTCVEAFQKCPGFRIQDLTRPDIISYVSDNLEGHSRFEQMQKDQPIEANTLVDSIVEKASGVFLWVILVTKSMLEGLSDFDEVEDLQARIDSYPPELHGLYKQMLQQMENLHKTQASKLLQIVYHRLKVRCLRPLTTIQLCYDNEHPTEALKMTSGPPKQKSELRRCQQMEGYLRSRCCGLVEVIPFTEGGLHEQSQRRLGELMYSNMSSTDMLKSEVQFLHKTVVDFLEDPEIWQFVLELCEDNFFEVNTSLVASSVCRIKSHAKYGVLDTREAEIYVYIRDCLFYARRAENIKAAPQTMYLRELDRAMSEHWAAASEWIRDINRDPNSTKIHAKSPRVAVSSLSSLDYHPTDGTWTVSIEYYGRLAQHIESFEALAVAYDLRLYVKDTFPAKAHKLDQSLLGKQLPQQVIMSLIQRPLGQEDTDIKLEMLALLLRCGADPSGAWTMFSSHISILSRTGPARLLRIKSCERLIQIFVQAGVDLNMPLNQTDDGIFSTLLANIESNTTEELDDEDDYRTERWEDDDGKPYRVRLMCGHSFCCGYSRCLQPADRSNVNMTWRDFCKILRENGATSKPQFPKDVTIPDVREIETPPPLVEESTMNRIVKEVIATPSYEAVETPVIKISSEEDSLNNDTIVVHENLNIKLDNEQQDGPQSNTMSETPSLYRKSSTRSTQSSYANTSHALMPDSPPRKGAMMDAFRRVWRKRSVSAHSARG